MTRVLAVLLLTATTAWSQQGGANVLSESYRVQFENDWVKVTRVRYGPFAKLPAHAHTPRPSAYVYLNDAGPVIFRHVGANGTAATRPATKAGSFRVYRGLEEIHEVENTVAVPSEFLRVELKTDATDPAEFRGKFYADPTSSADATDKIQFDHSQVSVSRMVLAPGRQLELPASQTRPSLYIALQMGRLRVVRRDGPSTISLKIGDDYWTPSREVQRVENLGSLAMELLRFDFKTTPQSPSPVR